MFGPLVFIATALAGQPLPAATDSPPRYPLGASALAAELSEMGGGGRGMDPREPVLELDDEHGLHYLWAPDIAPNCPDLDLSSEIGPEEAVACFFAARPALLERSGEDTRQPSWNVSDATAYAEDESTIVRVRQIHAGLRVRNGELVLTYRRGRLRSVLGHLYAPSAFPPGPSPLQAELTEIAASPSAVPDWVEVDRYYDVEAGQPVVEFLDEGTQYKVGLGLVDEALVREIDASDHQNLSPRSVAVGNYPDTFFNFFGVSQTATLLVDDKGSLVFLDHGTFAEDGEPATCATPDDKDNCWSLDSSGAPVFTPQWDFDIAPVFSGFPNTTKGRAASAHFWAHDQAVFANATTTAYDAHISWHGYDSENLTVVLPAINPCGSGACLRRHYGPFGTEEWRLIIPRDSNNVDLNLRLFSHEYGHAIHRQYGRGNDGSLLSMSLTEGFADHNTLRYALWRSATPRTYDGGFTALYDDNLIFDSTRDAGIKEVLGNGEAQPWGITIPLDDLVLWQSLTYGPHYVDSPCNGSADGTKEYRCGSLISVLYWTLAHNRLRVGYLGSPRDALILTTSPYTAGWLANVAFTWAIATLPNDSATIADYFNRVSERYWEFRTTNWISLTESDLVNRAIAVHCVGWSGWTCNHPDYHRTTWQRRPTLWTRKGSFAAGDLDHFLWAESMTRYGTPTRIGFGSADGLGYMELNSADDMLCATVNFPASGTYQLHGAILAASTAANTFSAAIGTTYLPWTAETVGGWIQSHVGPQFNVNAGNRAVCVKHLENMRIEALTVRRIQP